MKITDSKSLGQAIRERRKELNYTRSYLSDFTGLSVTFISDLERGKPTAEIEKTIRLINILGLDLLARATRIKLMRFLSSLSQMREDSHLFQVVSNSST